ncbi:MAG: hypothetical protein IJV01_04470 [Bacteroidales bacterium]|nr:hypothetical protein [Bacteroidales bacterium]
MTNSPSRLSRAYSAPDCRALDIRVSGVLCTSTDAVEGSFTTPRFGEGDPGLA